jgi:ribosomal protein S10
MGTQTRSTYYFRYASVDRDALEQTVGDIVNALDQRGAEYSGPVPHPRFVVRKFPRDPADLPAWVRDDYTEEELRMLKQVAAACESDYQLCIFYRTLQTRDQAAARALAERETPETVRVTMATEEVNVPTSGSNVPYTYDPNRDHVTDVDFDAHHG